MRNIKHAGYEVSVLKNAKRGLTIALDDKCRRDIKKDELCFTAIRNLVTDYETVKDINSCPDMLAKIDYIKKYSRRY